MTTALELMELRRDEDRLNWLNERTERLREVYWRIENEGGTVREAIDWLTKAQAKENA